VGPRSEEVEAVNWTIRNRILVLAGIAVGLVTLIGAIGWVATRGLLDANRRLATNANLLTNHLEVDVMHDALRADVYAGLAAVTASERATARTEFAEHAGRLQRALDLNLNLSSAPALRQALAAVRPELDGYVVAGQGILERVGRDDVPGARERLDDFRDRFVKLGQDLHQVRLRIDADSDRARQGTATLAHLGGVTNGIMVGLAVVLLLLAALQTARRIIGPIDAAVRALHKVAEGDLTARIEVAGHDEIQRMSNAVNRAAEGISGALAGIAHNAVALGNASEELATVAHQLTANSRETSTQTAVASSAAEEVNANVRLVAASAQEVGASIREVSNSAQEAAGVARSAVRAAERADRTVQQLGASSVEIGNVVKVITAIAGQTNILALNAEIEAARAGDAGKGFAVVANEVKELAKETARATDDIGRRVEAIQGDTQAAVKAIAEIVQIIERISATQTTIATAVEEQSAATAGITRNMGEAARGTGEIAATVGAVARAAESTNTGASETQQAAHELAMVASELQRLVSQFKYQGGDERASGTRFAGTWGSHRASEPDDMARAA
jgi:methyl-accepting chemotaxis protein